MPECTKAMNVYVNECGFALVGGAVCFEVGLNACVCVPE